MNEAAKPEGKRATAVTVADAADGRLDAGLGQTFGVADRDVLHAAITVMHETTPLQGVAIVEGLLQGIEHKVGSCRTRYSPTDDAPREGVDDEGT